MSTTGHIDYIELPASDIEATKRFFTEVFGWNFVDYGPDYVSWEGAGVHGGFFRSDRVARIESGSALVVLYSDSLEATLEKVQRCGGGIVKPIFSFPGGRRFHFADPNGNEFAVWSDRGDKG